MREFRSSGLLRRGLLAGKFSTWGNAEKGFALALGGFILSGANLFGQALPLGACMVAVLPMSLQTAMAALGATLGYFLRCEAALAAEYAAMTWLMLSATAVFQGTKLPALSWFMPTMAASVSAVLGGIGILGGGFRVGFYFTKILLSAIFCVVFRKAFRADRKSVWITAGVLVAGFQGFGIELGILAMLSCASGRITAVAIAAFALDLSGAYGQCVLPAFLLPALLSTNLTKKETLLRALSFSVLPSAVFFCFGELSFWRLTAMLCGAFVGSHICLPEHITDTANDRLHEAASVMETLSSYLPETVSSPSACEAEEVYDAAAERVCRCCPMFQRCWEHHAEKTYDALSSAAHSIIERGTAQEDDFPTEFQDTCSHFEGFLLAVNQELEGMLYRRRYRMQLQESRQVLSQELLCISEYLRQQQKEPKSLEHTAFVPQIGISTRNKKGERVSGDYGAYFAGANADFYILLCDGMGSGAPAALSSHETVRLLRQLLKSGLSAESALKLLNGAQILRQAQSYTTVDLLHIDLNTASAKLYKWGAAPSYLRHFDEIRTIGTATTPPGLSVQHEAERFFVSFRHEELLVLATDGADAEKIDSTLASYQGRSPRELAALLAATAQGEDDATVVAVCLQTRT